MKSTISLVLEDQIIAALDREANNASCSRSSIARVALKSFLNTRPASGLSGQASGMGVGPHVAADHADIIEQPGHVQGLRMKDTSEHLLHITVVPGGHFAAALQAGL